MSGDPRRSVLLVPEQVGPRISIENCPGKRQRDITVKPESFDARTRLLLTNAERAALAWTNAWPKKSWRFRSWPFIAVVDGFEQAHYFGLKVLPGSNQLVQALKWMPRPEPGAFTGRKRVSSHGTLLGSFTK